MGGRELVSKTGYTISLLRVLNRVSSLCKKEGDMGFYGIVVLSFFSSGIAVILILMCGIVVSSSPAVYGFSPFWLTVFGKRRYFTVLRYHLFSLSCRMQVNTMCNTKNSKIKRLILKS